MRKSEARSLSLREKRMEKEHSGNSFLKFRKFFLNINNVV